ncbi:hypothetical protein FRB96_003986 [Tulasnella sp. 330]|nr:hypothetical protein FRB96_003986 [Tulasnella sp. 330]KAG8882614.1 hypothetical protein FRB97_008041 [Tulasnella sp. 331]KAG8888882.1 hypothetical protein FRB98_006547 [Tulasnella sp. 332]
MAPRSMHLTRASAHKPSHRKAVGGITARKTQVPKQKRSKRIGTEDNSNQLASSSQDTAIETKDNSDNGAYLFFWKPSQDYGWASQWHDEPFKGPSELVDQFNGKKVQQIEYPTAETFMMYHKAVLFNDIEIAKKILDTTNPKETKALGRRIADFDEEIWEMKRYDIVLAGNMAKFKASEECRKELLATGERYLVEASPFDRIWGIGFTAQNALENKSRWGLNLLGKVLVDVRAALRKEHET